MKRDTGKRGCSAGRGRPAPGADPSGARRTLGISSSQTPLSRSGRLSVSYRTSSFSHLNAVSFLVFATYETEIPRLARESLWPLRKKSVLTLHCRLYGEAISAIDRLRRRPVETRPPRSRQTRFEVPASRTPAAGCRGRAGPSSLCPGRWVGLFVHTKPVRSRVFSARKHHDAFSEVYRAVQWLLLWQCGILDAATWGTEASAQDVPSGVRP